MLFRSDSDDVSTTKFMDTAAFYSSQLDTSPPLTSSYLSMISSFFVYFSRSGRVFALVGLSLLAWCLVMGNLVFSQHLLYSTMSL